MKKLTVNIGSEAQKELSRDTDNVKQKGKWHSHCVPVFAFLIALLRVFGNQMVRIAKRLLSCHVQFTVTRIHWLEWVLGW